MNFLVFSYSHDSHYKVGTWCFAMLVQSMLSKPVLASYHESGMAAYFWETQVFS